MSNTPVSDRYGAALAALAARSERTDRQTAETIAAGRAAAAEFLKHCAAIEQLLSND